MGTTASMDKTATTINAGGRWAPLTNLLLASTALQRAIDRAPNLPGIVSLSGPSGFGKSMAASYCANTHEGFYVECRSHFTKKTLALAILHEMGIKPARTLSEIMDQVAEQLDLSRKPLIIDECDYLVERGNTIEIIRDLHEAARTTILLVGEENFPRKLLKWERFHNRVLVWQLAQPASTDDARKLADFYAPGVKIDKDLLARVCEMSKNTARRICVNLDMIRNHCKKHGLKEIDLDGWGRRELYSGDAPPRRAV